MEYEERLAAVGSCVELMSSLDAFLRGQTRQKGVPWVDLGFPVVDRGAHAVFPLRAALTDGADAAAQDFSYINGELWNHWGYLYGGHEYRVGAFRESDEWGMQLLGKKLHTGGTRGRGPSWWNIANHVVIFVTEYHPMDGPHPYSEGLATALHVVPRDWIFAGHTTPNTKRDLSHCRRVVREVAAADFQWDWAQRASSGGGLWATSLPLTQPTSALHQRAGNAREHHIF